jgi:YVTN family beta-propeller protein
MAISADGTRLYVTSAGYNGGPDQVVVVDTAKLYYPETVANISLGQGVGATDVVLSPDGKRLYVLNGTSGGVSIIDTTTNTNIGVVPPLPSGPSPTAMAISADGTRLYVTSAGYNGGPDQVVVVDTAKLYYPETVANIAVGDYPADVAVSRDGKYLYVANGGDNTISVITLV